MTSDNKKRPRSNTPALKTIFTSGTVTSFKEIVRGFGRSRRRSPFCCSVESGLEYGVQIKEQKLPREETRRICFDIDVNARVLLHHF